MLRAWIQEQFGMFGRVDKRTGSVEIAFTGEKGIGIHPMNLYWQVRRPRSELRRWHTRVKQQRATCARTSLR